MLGAATRISPFNQFVILLGRLSYPVYILQSGFMPHMRGLPNHLGLHGAAAVLAILFLTLVFIVFAGLTLKYFDEPMRLG